MWLNALMHCSWTDIPLIDFCQGRASVDAMGSLQEVHPSHPHLSFSDPNPTDFWQVLKRGQAAATRR